jgi:hypothetical protein
MNQKSELERIFCDSGLEFQEGCREANNVSNPAEPE